MDCIVESARNLSISENRKDNCSFSIDDEFVDLDVKMGDRSLRAHKCIVRQCPYFAAMIDGNWIESQTSVVTLNGYSYKSVRFVIEHLYTPKEVIDDDSDLVELTALADMLGLHSLLDLVCVTMISKYCHSFHKPCQDCIGGVMTSYQLACTYNIVGLQTKCVDWITKYLTRTWNSRSFSHLPEPLQQICLESAKKTMCVDNIITLIKDCQRLLELLPFVKWVEPVKILVQQLLTDCTIFLQQHFHQVLTSSKFRQLGKSDTWDVSRVEVILLDAAHGLPVEQTCRSYVILEGILQPLESLHEDERPEPAYMGLMGNLHKAVESRLIRQVAMATKCSAWDSLSKTKQISIMQLGFFNPMLPAKGEGTKTNPPPMRTRTAVKRHPSSLNTQAGQFNRTSDERPALVRNPSGPRVRTATSVRIQPPGPSARPASTTPRRFRV